jgi:hypothetical protein
MKREERERGGEEGERRSKKDSCSFLFQNIQRCDVKG